MKQNTKYGLFATALFAMLVLFTTSAAAYTSVIIGESENTQPVILYNPYSGRGSTIGFDQTYYINGPSSYHEGYGDGYYDGKYDRNPNYCRYNWNGCYITRNGKRVYDDRDDDYCDRHDDDDCKVIYHVYTEEDYPSYYGYPKYYVYDDVWPKSYATYNNYQYRYNTPYYNRW